ncbi:MAG: hypothetical protein H8D23_04780 [Candidatus Brocadiales bacterium]|nr:hypothetical protein [Candidatus Brocadiales bacterium]
MGVLEWILVAIVISGLGQFGLLSLIAVHNRRVPWGQKRAGVRPPRKSAAKAGPAHIDIDTVKPTLDIPAVQSSKIGVQETKIEGKSQLDALRKLKK